MVDAGRHARLDRLLTAAMAGLLVCELTLRTLVNGASAGLGLNLLIHSLVWVAGLCWAARAALAGELRVAAVGADLPLVAYFVVAGVSPLVAAHKLPAFGRAWEIWSAALLCYGVANLGAGRGGGRDDAARGAVLMVAVVTGLALAESLYGAYQVVWGLPRLRERIAGGELAAPVDVEHADEFAWRLGTDEAFGTLGLSNALAGFLLLALPVAVAMAVDAIKHSKRGTTNLSYGGAWAGAAGVLLAGLWLTGSRGGWLAAAGGLAFLAAIGLWRRSGRWRTALAGTAVVALGAGGALWAAGVAGPAALRAASKSASVRLDYWSAAAKVIDEAPLTGVGLDNFGEHYLRHKAPGAQETLRAHNDYIDAWAELGLAGFLAFAGVWVVFFTGVLRRGGATGGEAGDSELRIQDAKPSRAWRGAALAGGGAAFLLAAGRTGVFLDDGATAAAGLACLAAWGGWVWWLTGRGLDLRAAEPGLAAGVAGFALHAAIDMDWSSPAIQQAVLAILACAVLARRRGDEPPAVRAPLGAFGGALALVPFAAAALALAGLLVPRAMRADAAYAEAEGAFADAERIRARAHAEGDTAAAGGSARAAVERYATAQQALLEGIAANPWDARLYDMLASALSAVGGRGPEAGGAEQEVWLEHMVDLQRRAAELSPRSAGLRARLALGWELLADRLAAKAVRSGDGRAADPAAARAQQALEHARAAWEEAVDRYPARPLYRYRLGRALERLGLDAAAKEAYRKALELDAQQAPDLRRLRLAPEVREELSRKTE